MSNRTPLLIALASSAALAGAIALGACATGDPATPDPEGGTAEVLEPGSDASIDPSECGGQPTFAAIQTGIFSASCAFGSCHGGVSPAAGLDLTPGKACGSLVNVSSCELAAATMLVAPGDPDASYLYRKVVGQDLGSSANGACGGLTEGTPQRMPLGGTPLCEGQIEQIRDWIQAGASCTADGDASFDDAAISLDAGPPLDAATDAGSTTEVDAGEPTVATITSAGSVAVGGEIVGTVTLTAPAPAAGVAVILDSSAATVVAVPSAVLVPAGQSSGTFAIQGISSGSAAVRAVTVGSPASMNVQVGSGPPPPPTAAPTLVELFYDDGQHSNGEQWIRLYNATSETIDLSQFSIGAGQASYTETTAQLSGTLPPGGCFVVGGPTSSAYNGDPVYSQGIHFLPNFATRGGANGAGVAVFNAPAANISASLVPVSAVVYGASNAAGLLAPGGSKATPVPDVASAGDSLLLQNTTWIDNALPTPNSCP